MEEMKMLRLTNVDEDNWMTDLGVAPGQKEYVLNPMGILARAYAYRNSGSRAFLIQDDDTPIGMALRCDYPELESYELNQFFIDERYQGQGYGKAAMRLILEEMRREGKYRKVVLWYIDGNDAAKNLYEHLGFTKTGSIQDEIGMTLNL